MLRHLQHGRYKAVPPHSRALQACNNAVAATLTQQPSRLDSEKAAALEVSKKRGDEILMEKHSVLPDPRQRLASRASTPAEDHPQRPRALQNRSQQRHKAREGMVFPLHHPQLSNRQGNAPLSDGKREIIQSRKYCSNHLPVSHASNPLRRSPETQGNGTVSPQNARASGRLTHFVGFPQAPRAVCCLQHVCSVYLMFR